MYQSLRKGLLLTLVLTSFSVFGQKIDENFAQNFKQTQKQASFQENKGQIIDQDGNLRTDIKFSYNAPGLKVHFKADGWSYETYMLEEKQELTEATLEPLNDGTHPFGKEQPKEFTIHTHRVDIEFKKSNRNSKINPENALEDYSNFYTYKTPEEGILNVKSYRKITYKNIWNNIDIEWVAKGTELKYNIILHPGADPKDIQMVYQGANALQLKEGKLETSVSFALTSGIEKNNLTESIPAVFGAEGASFTLNNKTIGFELAGWDQTSTAIIDPQLIWGTYYGGSNDDIGKGISIDNLDNIYITGSTSSSSGISTSGSHQTSRGGSTDAFVVKFNRNGVRQWATYYGGSSSDYAEDVSTNDSGNVYITGSTESDGNIASNNAHENWANGKNFYAFIVKLNSNGVRQWGTYFGGPYDDYGNSLKSDDLGNVYVVGYANTWGLATSGAHQTSGGGVFLVKFNTNGVLQWATYYGGSCSGIALDTFRNIYIIGYTQNTSNISSTGAHQDSLGGNNDAFIVKFNTNGVRQWATYYGGTGNDIGVGISTDLIGNLYITGYTTSTNNISTTGSHQTSLGGNNDAFIVKFNTNGVRQWATYYGGSNNDYGNGIATDFFGNVFLIGYTNSTNAIATTGSYQTTLEGGNDALVTEFNTNGVRLWGSYYGGTNNENGKGVKIDSLGNVVIIGETNSTSNISTTGSYQTTIGGSKDAFLVKLKGILNTDSNFWIGTLNTNWYENRNWSKLIYPDSSDIIFIKKAKNNCVIKENENITVSKLYFIDTGFLTFDSKANGVFRIDSGIINDGGSNRLFKNARLSKIKFDWRGDYGLRYIDTIRTLRFNCPQPYYLDSHLVIIDSLNLNTNNPIVLGRYHVYFGDSIKYRRAGNKSYLRISDTGRVYKKILPGDSFIFPIGYNPYVPIHIANNLESTQYFQVGITQNSCKNKNNWLIKYYTKEKIKSEEFLISNQSKRRRKKVIIK